MCICLLLVRILTVQNHQKSYLFSTSPSCLVFCCFHLANGCTNPIYNSAGMCATQCVRNQLLQGPSTLDIMGQFRPSACLSLLPVCRYQWYFQVCLPHYSLLIYFLLGLCSANANDFSKQSASYWRKKKNPFSQRLPDWHLQILMASKLISALLSIAIWSLIVELISLH